MTDGSGTNATVYSYRIFAGSGRIHRYHRIRQTSRRGRGNEGPRVDCKSPCQPSAGPSRRRYPVRGRDDDSKPREIREISNAS